MSTTYDAIIDAQEFNRNVSVRNNYESDYKTVLVTVNMPVKYLARKFQLHLANAEKIVFEYGDFTEDMDEDKAVYSDRFPFMQVTVDGSQLTLEKVKASPKVDVEILNDTGDEEDGEEESTSKNESTRRRTKNIRNTSTTRSDND